MDGDLLEIFGEFVVPGTPDKIETLGNLTESETMLFNSIKSQNLRLEQERIPQWYVIQEIGKTIK